jgi:DNA-binding GntR family transcriptional regulator
MDGRMSVFEQSWGADFDPKRSIATQLYRRLRGSILTQKLAPNTALSEKDLAAQFGVSRTPVREALIKLADDGLVDVLPQRGTFVAPIRIAEVIEAQFIREALEIAVIRRVAAAPTPALLAQLDEALRQQQTAVDTRDLDTFLQLDENFHKAFCDYCELPRGWKVIQNVKGQLDRIRYLSLPEPGHLAILLDQHRQVVEAVRAGQPDLAAAQLKRHLQEVFGTVKYLVEQDPSLFGITPEKATGT